MHYLKPFLLIVVLLTNQIVLAQKYTSPVDFNILLSGTFGELRNNHFHAGIDIKTEGVEGQNIRAIADGVDIFRAGKLVFLTEEIPPKYLLKVSPDDPDLVEVLEKLAEEE